MPLPMIFLTLAKGALTSVIGPFIEEAREATLNVAQNKIRSAVAGRMSVEEWADIVIDGVDTVKDRITDEGGLRFIGGKLKFSISVNESDNVSVSFQLYYQDEDEQWQKAEADSDIPASLFTNEAFEALSTEGEIVFEVE